MHLVYVDEYRHRPSRSYFLGAFSRHGRLVRIPFYSNQRRHGFMGLQVSALPMSFLAVTVTTANSSELVMRVTDVRTASSEYTNNH